MKLEILPRTDLAVRAIRYLDAYPGANSISMAEELGTTFGYLTQVLRPLVEAGYLTSSRGPNGGYRLSAKAASLSVLDTIECMEGPTDDGVCALRGSTCDASNPCSLHDAWTSARSALITELENVPVVGARERTATC